jgi:phage head maturation protease
MEEGRSVRTIKRVDSLIDVSPTTFPAYPDSDVAVAKRSYDAFRQSLSAIRESRTVAACKANELREYLKQHGR